MGIKKRQKKGPEEIFFGGKRSARSFSGQIKRVFSMVKEGAVYRGPGQKVGNKQKKGGKKLGGDVRGNRASRGGGFREKRMGGGIGPEGVKQGGGDGVSREREQKENLPEKNWAEIVEKSYDYEKNGGGGLIMGAQKDCANTPGDVRGGARIKRGEVGNAQK